MYLFSHHTTPFVYFQMMCIYLIYNHIILFCRQRSICLPISTPFIYFNLAHNFSHGGFLLSPLLYGCTWDAKSYKLGLWRRANPECWHHCRSASTGRSRLTGIERTSLVLHRFSCFHWRMATNQRVLQFYLGKHWTIVASWTNLLLCNTY